MIKVLQVVDCLKQRYGVTSFLMNYIRNIDTDVVRFDFLIIDSEDDIKNELCKMGCKISYMPKLGLKNYEEVKKAISNCLNENEYQIVHSHFYQIDFILFDLCKRFGIKHRIAHSHCNSFGDGITKKIRNKLLSLMGNNGATEYCACSLEAGYLLFGRNKKIHIISNAINDSLFTFDINKRNEIRRLYGVQDNTLVFGHIGSFKECKNHKKIVSIFSEICKISNNVLLILVGDGELLDVTKTQVENLNLGSKVIFAGVSNKADAFCSAFDCLLFPSIYEGLGLVLIEAQAADLPFIASNVIPNEARLDPECKFLSLQTDSDKCWAESAIEIGKKRFGIRQNRTALIEQGGFSIQKESQKLVKYYSRLIGE